MPASEPRSTPCTTIERPSRASPSARPTGDDASAFVIVSVTVSPRSGAGPPDEPPERGLSADEMDDCE